MKIPGRFTSNKRPTTGRAKPKDYLYLLSRATDIHVRLNCDLATIQQNICNYIVDRLGCVEVKWSPRMTLCAGLCRYVGRNGQCSIHLSKPLLSLRPRKDLIETLLHEMIHAYLFVADKNKERESHGPKFVEMMNSINREANTNITIYHSFHDEVDSLKIHVWQCNGPCKSRSPYYGIVKRSMNRAPGPSDFWFKDHKKSCNGSFVKIKEPVKSAPKNKVSGKQKLEPRDLKKISDVFPKVPYRNGFSRPESNNTISFPPNVASGHNDTKKRLEEIAIPSQLKHSDEGTTFSTSGVVAYSGNGYVLGMGKFESSVRPPQRENHPLLRKWDSNKEAWDGRNLNGSKKDVGIPVSQIPGAGASQVVDISSEDENSSCETQDFCPACGIDYPSFLQTLEEHLQMCEMLSMNN